MDAVESSRDRVRLDDLLVVDADVHAHDTPGALLPYCDMPWRKSLEVLKDVPERYLDIPGFSSGIGSLMPTFPGGGGRVPLVHTAEQMRHELDALGIDVAVIFPDNLLKLAILPSADYAATLARAYNRWVVDRWADRRAGLVAAIIAAPQDPVDAARQIERYAGDRRVVAVYLPTCAVSPLWGDRRYDPVFAAAQEADLPVALHSVTAVHPVFPFQLEQFDTEMARHTIAHPFALMANLISLITTGVPARFPRLRICFTEGGVSWVPFIMWRLDKEYGERRREVPFLEERPSAYIRRMYFATQPIEEPDDPADLARLISLFGGEDTVLFASDWPHHDFDHPRKLFSLPVAGDVKRRLFGGNAQRLFGLDDAVRRPRARAPASD